MAKPDRQPTKASKPTVARSKQTTVFATRLRHLHFDPTNPRFAHRVMPDASETAILDEIVKTYGVQDVISSIAVNGYLGTEPLVAIRLKKGSEDVRVIEG